MWKLSFSSFEPLNGKSHRSKSHEDKKQNLSLEERRVSDIKVQALNVNQSTIQDTRDWLSYSEKCKLAFLCFLMRAHHGKE